MLPLNIEWLDDASGLQCFNESHILPLSMVVIFIYRYFSLYLSLSVSHSHSLFLPPSLPLSHSLAISFFFLSLIILYVSLSLFFLFFFFFLCLSFFLSPSLILSYISVSPHIICIFSHEIQLCKYLNGPSYKKRAKLLYQKAIMTRHRKKTMKYLSTNFFWDHSYTWNDQLQDFKHLHRCLYLLHSISPLFPQLYRVIFTL